MVQKEFLLGLYVVSMVISISLNQRFNGMLLAVDTHWAFMMARCFWKATLSYKKGSGTKSIAKLTLKYPLLYPTDMTIVNPIPLHRNDTDCQNNGGC